MTEPFLLSENNNIMQQYLWLTRKLIVSMHGNARAEKHISISFAKISLP